MCRKLDPERMTFDISARSYNRRVLSHLPTSAATVVRWGAFLTWLLVGIAPVLLITVRPWLRPEIAGLWAVAFLAFGAGLWGAERRTRPERAGTVTPLVVQTVAVIGMAGTICTGLEGVLLAVVAAQLVGVLTLPAALLWVLLQTMAMGFALSFKWPWPSALLWSAGYFGIQGFALLVSYVAFREARARRQLAGINNELVSTQRILIDHERTAERLRISRELHDLMGHHLTALSLRLEAASHTVGAEAAHDLGEARSIVKTLLDDVRQVVTTLRDRDAIDLEHALQTLVAGVAKPRIHLTVIGGLKTDSPARAHLILRCVQEIVTNAVKHAAADNLWIDIATMDGTLRITGRDDGLGVARVQPGTGLTGMRERLEESGGRLELASVMSGGFSVDASVPLREGKV